MISKPLLRYFIILFLILVAFPGHAQDIVDLPEIKTFVTDETATLTESYENQLESKLRDLQNEKGSQLIVVVLPTTGLEPIEDFTIRLAEEIQAGREGVDDGVILLIAKEDRRVRIEVGYGLEGAITDAQSRMIIENSITPRFKNGDFEGGISKGVDDLIHLIRGEPLPEATRQTSKDNGVGLKNIFPILIFFFIILPPLLTKLLGKVLGGVVGTGASFVLGWLLVSIGVGFMAAIFFAVFSLFSAIGGRGGGGRRGGGMGGFGGFGGGGGGFSGGGGFGGFSGGGGSFGGGGASGSW